MSSLTLSQVKNHLRVELVDGPEDALIERLIEAAEVHVRGYLRSDLPDPMPKPVEAAVLLLVGDMYEHRSSQVERSLHNNMTFDLLLHPYRNLEVL